jgi:DNA-binding IclR family transcriptional regulator
MSLPHRSFYEPARPTPPLTDTGITTLDRTTAILEAVERGAHSFTDIVTATGLTRSTTHRLLNALTTNGFLAKAGGLGYMLGPRLLHLAHAAARDLPLKDIARPILERLATATGESAQLYTRLGDERICIDSVQSASELRTIVQPGAALPITAGSAGKIFLAWSTPDTIERLTATVEPLTDRTPTDPDRIYTQLQTARRRGWAESVGERAVGVASVSAPVLGARDVLLAVISVSGPRNRMGPQPGKHYGTQVIAAARDLAAAIGGAAQAS